MRFMLICLAVFAGGLILTALPSYGQGTVVYHNAGDVFLHSSGGDSNTLGIDMDSNGTDDFVFEAFTSFRVYSTVGGKSVAIPAGGNDLNSFSIPLLGGFQVGLEIADPLRWVSSFQPGFPPGHWIGQTLHARNSAGSLGYWNPEIPNSLTAYVGVGFEIEGADHYGWIQVTAGSIGNGGWINDWAYNSVPGEMIFAGQVPEPSTWVLLIAGGFLLSLRCRRNSKVG